MSATPEQTREIELLSRLRGKDIEIADLRQRLDALRMRVLLKLARTESDLIALDHRECADLVYAIAVDLGSIT